MKLTQAQQAAIKTKNKTLLLSAAAGSGKTSTLTRRIIDSITCDGADISKMLIVTFTRASANDLKTKIFNAVSDALAADPQNKHLTGQLIKLGSAKISTIDAFYLSSVKQNFSALGIPSSFRIADNSETALLAKNIMREVTEEFYDTDEDFSSLCECFERIRDTEGVCEEVFLSLYTDCMRTPEGVEYLKLCADRMTEENNVSFIDTAFGAVVKEYAMSLFSGYLEHYDRVLESMTLDEKLSAAYYDAMNKDRVLCIKALELFKANADYSNIASLLSEFEFQGLKTLQSKYASDLSRFAKALRDDFKSSFADLRDEFFCYSREDFSRFFELTAKQLTVMYRVLSAFESRYAEEKGRRGILELTDIKRYALKLFVSPDGTPTELAKSYSTQFTDIYIDEYQDVDPVQDLIFRCISTPTNRFMVGDIKQSIYGFRGARPQLFADYRADFPMHESKEAESSDCETIFMSENFRCSKPVIDFTNLVCAPPLKACGDSIGYTDEDDLVFAKASPDGSDPSPRVTVAVFAKNSKKALEQSGIDPEALPSPAEAEAKYIADNIRRLLSDGKKQNGSRITPKDIAVLFRNKTAASRIADALSELGIPTSSTESTQYFQNPDVMMTLCILNSVDNPQRDVYLAGAMRSPIFGFTLDDLLKIDSLGDKTASLYDKLCICASEDGGELNARCKDFCDTLDRWRSVSVSMPIDKFLRYIFSSESFVASGMVCEKNSMGEGGNLQRLYEYARTFEAGSFKGLYNFIEFINNIIDNGETIEAKDEGMGADVVTLTTIHKSKGLEFPVCFLCNASADFKSGSSADDLSFEYGLGVAMTLSDSTGFAKYTSPLKKALDLYSRQKGVEEEMRVLYVALTRAREQLFVTAGYSRSQLSTVTDNASFRARFDCQFSALNARSFMDWILPPLCIDQRDCAELFGYTTDALPVFSEQAPSPKNLEDTEQINTELYERLKEKFAFTYSFSDMRRIPAKLSVSKLSPDVLDESDISVDLFDVESSPSVPTFFTQEEKKPTSAERGTATHLFLQFCDFSLVAKEGIEQSLEILTAKGFIPKSMAETVYIKELENLRSSDFMKHILNAKKVIREQRFNILLPTSEFTHDLILQKKIANERIAVQGVIDLIIIDEVGNIELYDYKTDRLSRAELTDDALALEKMNKTHGLQLSYYSTAVTYLFGKAPKRVAVYSTHAAKLFDIRVQELSLPYLT